LGGKLGNLGCSKNAKISDQIEEKDGNYYDATITSHNGQSKVFKLVLEATPEVNLNTTILDSKVMHSQ